MVVLVSRTLKERHKTKRKYESNLFIYFQINKNPGPDAIILIDQHTEREKEGKKKKKEKKREKKRESIPPRREYTAS